MTSTRGASTAARPSGRRRGPSGTRELILIAARRQFAHCGYDRASMRAIATDAGVDQKLIAHFFGSKQKLFLAAIDLPLNPGEVIRAVLSGNRADIGERLAAVLVSVLQGPERHQRLTGVIRAAASDPEVARMLREYLAREVFAVAEELLGVPDARLRANLVGSQFVGLVMARYVVGLEPLADTAPEVVAAAIAPTLQRYLTGDLAATEASQRRSRAARPPAGKRHFSLSEAGLCRDERYGHGKGNDG
jgi:AcrR family transcriptional regulator